LLSSQSFKTSGSTCVRQISHSRRP
jgi:hypothetical protein